MLFGHMCRLSICNKLPCILKCMKQFSVYSGALYLLNQCQRQNFASWSDSISTNYELNKLSKDEKSLLLLSETSITICMSVCTSLLMWLTMDANLYMFSCSHVLSPTCHQQLHPQDLSHSHQGPYIIMSFNTTFLCLINFVVFGTIFSKTQCFIHGFKVWRNSVSKYRFINYHLSLPGIFRSIGNLNK